MSVLALFLYAFGFLILVIITQDIHIFPGALFSILSGSKRDPKTLPPDIESIFIETDDGKRIEVWRLPADFGTEQQPYIAVIFHGNAGNLKGFLALQLWFSYLGITSYNFDYRGFGKSSGWPSEKGIERDSDAFWQYVLEREQVDPSRIIVMGYSVGGAPAARIASLHQPKALLLLSAFTDLKQVAREQPIFGFLAVFAWYRLPTLEYVQKLKSTSLILAHGERDKIIRPYHTEKLKDAYVGDGSIKRLTSPTSGHNDLFFTIRQELADTMMSIVGKQICEPTPP